MITVLASCGPLAIEPAEPPEEIEARADDARGAGDYGRAAELYDEAAEAYEEDAQRQRATLAAVRARVRAGEAEAARETLERLDREALDARGQRLHTLVRAELLLADGNAPAAEALLAHLDEPPEGEEAAYHRLRAEAAEMREAPLEAAEHWSGREAHLDDPEALEANREATWAALSRAPAEQLRAADPDAHPDATWAGWLRLAQLAQEHRLDPDRLEEAVAAWESAHPEHPAREAQAPELITRFRERVRQPEHIGVLLPLSGTFADAAEAVRDGILLAHYAADGDRPRITVHDTGDEPETAREALAEAREAGADAVLGPLTREAVRALAEAELDDETPILALNRLEGLDGEPPPRLYRFPLEPEAEARQAAEYALARGWREAVVLTPDGSWGDRIRDAFEAAYEDGDGIVLQSVRYDPDDADHSGALREVLNLRVSEERHRELTRTLGEQPEFTPRRRQDADAVFLAASPASGRLLRPQLDFHHAQDLPALATSHIYGGVPQPDDDRDLDGLYFLEAPWLLGAGTGVPEGLEHGRLAQALEPVMERHARLVALGIDAYRMLPYLAVLADHPEERLEGLTGQLRLREDGRVERDLVPARFRGGMPRLALETMEGTDEPETEQEGQRD